MYTAQQAAKLLNVSDVTIREWAKEFANYLSPTANPGRQRKRQFTRDDMAVFALAAELKGQGQHNADVHAALSNNERGTPPDLEPDDVQAVMISEQERRQQFEITRLQQELVSTKEELEEANAIIISLNTKIAVLERELELAKEGKQDTRDLLIEIGMLRAKVEALENSSR